MEIVKRNASTLCKTYVEDLAQYKADKHGTMEDQEIEKFNRIEKVNNNNKKT